MTDKEAIRIAFHTLVNLTSVDEYGSKEEIISKHTTMGTLRQALAQPEREWVGLTDDDHKDFADRTKLLPILAKALAEFIEAKLKEKNT